MVDLLSQSGKSQGELATFLKNNQSLNAMSMRPWRADDGKSYITTYQSGDPKVSTSYENKLVANSTLRQDEWKELDQAVLGVARDKLVGINDLVAAGLTYNLGNALGTTVFDYDQISDGMEASMTMDGVTRS